MKGLDFLKKLFCLLLMAVVFITAAIPALAADLYPADIEYEQSGNAHIIRKTYHLAPSDDPASIPTADFERGGYSYSFTDMTKNYSEFTEKMDYTKTETLPSKTDNMDEVLKLFAPTLDTTTEDGFFGTLILDHTTIRVSADGYNNRSYAVTATRTYPNLSAADVSLVPKTTEDKGRTLELSDVTWQELSAGSVDDYSIATHYTATATYSGTATSRTVTGYTATADYSGEVMRDVPGAIIYTAIFESVEAVPEPEPTPEAKPEATAKPTDAAPAPTNGPPSYFMATVLLLIFGFGGYALIRLSRWIKRRREG